MQRNTLPAAVVIFALGMALASPASYATSTQVDVCASRSVDSFNATVRGDYKAAEKYFSSDLAKAIPPGAVSKAWKEVQQRQGSYERHNAPRIEAIGNQRYVVTQMWFAKGPLNHVVACNSAGQITYSHWMFDAAGVIKSAKPHTFPSGVRTEPLTVMSHAGPLPALLTLPSGSGPFPGVVMLVGSGEQDMNESAGPNKPFQDLALGLARLGVASLRFDKLTYAYRLKAASNPALTVDDIYTDDALTAVALLKRQHGINANDVFVLGHSLGAMMATRVGKRDPKLAGLVLLGAPANPPLQKALRQMKHGVATATNATAKAQFVKAAAAIRKELALVSHANPNHPPKGAFSGMPQSFWVSLHHVHAVANVKQLVMPVFIVQGAADQAVSPRYSFLRWKRAFAHSSRVTLKLYPGLNHALLPVASKTSQEHANTRRHMSPEVIADIAAWVKEHSANPSPKQ